jgi:ADP-L-glycero-D-manno-heptose 6-epimerase
MKIILTGGAGFIGSCFLAHLNEKGMSDVVIVDVGKDPSTLPNLRNKKFSEYLSREALLTRLDQNQLTDVDGIIHMGACSDTTEMDRAFLARNNVEYSKSLARWALGHNKFFHYASSAAIYGDGKQGYDDADESLPRYQALNPYGESKLIFDRWLVDQNLTSRVVGYRYFNVFGPNELHKGEMRSMVCKAFQQIQAEGKAKLFATSRSGYGDGSEERDFVYIKDINHVMAFFLEHLDKHGIFNMGTGQARTFKDLVTAVFNAMGKPVNIEYIPMPEKLKGQYQYFTQAKMEKLGKVGTTTAFQSLEESVADYVKNHLQKNGGSY